MPKNEIVKVEPAPIAIPSKLPSKLPPKSDDSTNAALKIGYAIQVAAQSVRNNLLLTVAEQAQEKATRAKTQGGRSSATSAGSASRATVFAPATDIGKPGPGDNWEVCPPTMFEPGE